MTSLGVGLNDFQRVCMDYLKINTIYVHFFFHLLRHPGFRTLDNEKLNLTVMFRCHTKVVLSI